ncbi:beta-galactosidase [Bogoriella caseilytica]|uniref:beta-galactosidase n=1 Tax=Bogoriella caseilytica TaxID=56055 RepID=A0A3N2BAW2_9MICO|nr:beta-galactosidase [Bogoriella caseilytica]ROR72423.1 beta-galactosidase [Bogoriella caseilytica]
MKVPVGFGAAYYLEYQPTPRLAADMRLMQEAGFSVIRVGESTWSRWEPRPGEFRTAWMREILDAAHEHGIEVILGTPTYAAPMWLAVAEPGIAADAATGRPKHWGSRQEIDITSTVFRRYAERVIRRILEDLAEHPAVIGYQVDNESGVMLLHNEKVFIAFREWLAKQHGDVEELNARWGLAYWSHELTTYDELWRPDGNAQPEYDLAWRRFQAELVTDYIRWQADLVRSLGRKDQFVTTCMAIDRVAMDDVSVARELDVAAGNLYFRMQDNLAHPTPADRPQGWMTAGTWSVFLSADRLYGTRHEPFLVTETNAGAIAHSNVEEPGWDGQWRQAAWAMIARGARLIEYWHWHTNHVGTETHWVGILPHDQRPGRVYRNIAELGAELRRHGALVEDTVPDAEVAFVFSTDSKYALAFEPAFADEARGPASRSYQRLLEPFYQGAFTAGLQSHIVHDRELPTAEELLERYPVVVVPGLYVAQEETLATLRRYAELGGHLVIGPRTGYTDEVARVRVEPQPGGLAELAGASYQEFSTPPSPIEVGFEFGGRGRATGWIELLEATEAEVLARYRHPHHGAFAAATTRVTGAGRTTLVGFVPDDESARTLFSWVAQQSGLTPEVPSAPSVTHASTSSPARRVHFYFNWSWAPAEIAWPDGRLSPEGEAATVLSFGAWDTKILVEDLSISADTAQERRQ